MESPRAPREVGAGLLGAGRAPSWSPRGRGASSAAAQESPGRAGERAGPGAGRGAGSGQCPVLSAPSPGRARQSGGKVRHKRQALQDMARPLKQWLYKHRDNPYPTKTEKILLALGSQMTLVQVRKGTPYPHLQQPL